MSSQQQMKNTSDTSDGNEIEPSQLGAQDDAVAERTAPPADQDGKFEVVDEKRLERVVQRAIMRAESYSGPIAHPEHLERFERTYPGASAIIFEEYKANSAHTRQMERDMLALENKKLDAAVRRDGKSLRGAFVLTLVGLLVVVICALLHETALGIAVAATLLVAVLRAYLPRAWFNSKSEEPPKAKSSADEDPEDSSGSSPN